MVAKHIRNCRLDKGLGGEGAVIDNPDGDCGEVSEQAKFDPGAC